MAGFALAQLGFGPLSDRFGRRAPLIGACALFTASGLFCALASGVGALLAWRFVEGAGGARFWRLRSCATALKADARAKMGAISAVMTAAPMIAPSLGALVLRVGDWRMIFLVLALAGLALTAVVALAVDESIPAHDPAALSPRRLLRSYGRALTTAPRSAIP
jgi:MFS transporter, DHA1 family, multidrug resistance protein